jgi:tetratricopeptide (TPR) repeat protein
VRSLLEEGLTIHRELGSRWGVATSLLGLGLLASDHADYLSAHPLFEESLAIYRELGDRWGVANSLQGLSVLALDQADYASARPLLEECLAIRRALGDKWGLAGLIEVFAALKAMECKPEQAARLWGAAEALRGSIGAPLPPRDYPRHEKYVSTGRVQLGEPAFTAAWAEGQMTPLEQVISHVLEGTSKV